MSASFVLWLYLSVSTLLTMALDWREEVLSEKATDQHELV